MAVTNISEFFIFSFNFFLLTLIFFKHFLVKLLIESPSKLIDCNNKDINSIKEIVLDIVSSIIK